MIVTVIWKRKKICDRVKSDFIECHHSSKARTLLHKGTEQRD